MPDRYTQPAQRLAHSAGRSAARLVELPITSSSSWRFKTGGTNPTPIPGSRVAFLRQYGAEVILTPGILMAEAVARANQITAQVPGAINLDQFSNPANPALHKRTTEVEIWNDTNGPLPLTDRRSHD